MNLIRLQALGRNREAQRGPDFRPVSKATKILVLTGDHPANAGFAALLGNDLLHDLLPRAPPGQPVSAQASPNGEGSQPVSQ